MLGDLVRRRYERDLDRLRDRLLLLERRDLDLERPDLRLDLDLDLDLERRERDRDLDLDLDLLRDFLSRVLGLASCCCLLARAEGGGEGLESAILRIW